MIISTLQSYKFVNCFTNKNPRKIFWELSDAHSEWVGWAFGPDLGRALPISIPTRFRNKVSFFCAVLLLPRLRSAGWLLAGCSTRLRCVVLFSDVLFRLFGVHA